MEVTKMFFALAFFAAWAAGAVGWVMNIIKLVEMLGGDVTAFFVARIAGLFVPPLGAVLGFM